MKFKFASEVLITWSDVLISASEALISASVVLICISGSVALVDFFKCAVNLLHLYTREPELMIRQGFRALRCRIRNFSELSLVAEQYLRRILPGKSQFRGALCVYAYAATHC